MKKYNDFLKEEINFKKFLMNKISRKKPKGEFFKIFVDRNHPVIQIRSSMYSVLDVGDGEAVYLIPENKKYGYLIGYIIIDNNKKVFIITSNICDMTINKYGIQKYPVDLTEKYIIIKTLKHEPTFFNERQQYKTQYEKMLMLSGVEIDESDIKHLSAAEDHGLI